MDKMNTHKKKVTKRKSSSETSIRGPNNLVTLNPNVTNVTLRKRGSKEKYSPHAGLQEQEDIATTQIEELLKAAKDLEKALLAFPSLETHLAEVERIIERMETELEVYSNG